MNTQAIPNSKLRLESLDLLRFPLAIIVVIEHVFGATYIINGGGKQYPVFSEVNLLIEGLFKGQSVPIYFFISGYVFFLGITLTKQTYIQKLRRRVKTLFVPYIIWNTLAIIQILLSFYLSLSSEYDKIELNLTLSGILNCFWDNSNGILRPQTAFTGHHLIYPQDAPLWFVRDLMIVVMCTPIVYYILKRMRCYALYILGIIWFIKGYHHWGHFDQLITAFFFFSWGAYMSINRKLVEFGKFFRLSTILYIILSLTYTVSYHYYPDTLITIKQLTIFVGLIFSYNLASWLLRLNICRPNTFLASASFFIYVSHNFVFIRILHIMYSILQPTSDICVIVLYTSALLVTLGCLLLIFWLLRLCCPKLLRIMTGKK